MPQWNYVARISPREVARLSDNLHFEYKLIVQSEKEAGQGHQGYRIRLTTHDGAEIEITGCHDMGPCITINGQEIEGMP